MRTAENLADFAESFVPADNTTVQRCFIAEQDIQSPDKTAAGAASHTFTQTGFLMISICRNGKSSPQN